MSRELIRADGYAHHGRHIDVAVVHLPADAAAVRRAIGWSRESTDRTIEAALGLPELAAGRLSAIDRKRVIAELRRLWRGDIIDTLAVVRAATAPDGCLNRSHGSRVDIARIRPATDEARVEKLDRHAQDQGRRTPQGSP